MSVKKKFKGLSDKAVAWLFIGPSVFLLLAINIYPLIYAIRMSFTNFYANKIGREPQFIGLKNYIKVLNKEAIWEKNASYCKLYVLDFVASSSNRFRFSFIIK